MAKKLIVQRNLRRSQGGGAPYLKYLVFSALGLIFLVVITPYLLRDKSRETAKKMPVPERGTITKELPQQAQQQPAQQQPAPQNANESATAGTPPESVVPPLPGASTPPESGRQQQSQPAPAPAQNPASASQQATPPQTQPAPAQGETGVTAPRETSPPEAANKLQPAAPEKTTTPVQPAEEPETSQKLLFPKGNSAAAAEPGNPRAKAAAQTGGKAQRAKKTYTAKQAHKPKKPPCVKPKPRVCAKSSESYSVQVGSVFRDLKQAVSTQKRLAAKGYRASVHRAPCSGYLVVTSPSSQSSAYTLREQMNSEGLKNTKVVGFCPKPTQAGQQKR